jgi:hypothetical protein
MSIEDRIKQAERLGIINIDVFGDVSISPEVIEAAIRATKRLNSRLDESIIKQKLQEADSIVAAQHR